MIDCFKGFYINPVGLKVFVDLSLHKKWSFPLRISSVNLTTSAVSFGFGHTFTEEILNGKLYFLYSGWTDQMYITLHATTMIDYE